MALNTIRTFAIPTSLSLTSTATTVGAPQLQFYPAFGSPSNYVGLRAPNVITTDYTLTLPDVPPLVGQTLVSDALGNLSWISGGTTQLIDADADTHIRVEQSPDSDTIQMRVGPGAAVPGDFLTGTDVLNFSTAGFSIQPPRGNFNNVNGIPFDIQAGQGVGSGAGAQLSLRGGNANISTGTGNGGAISVQGGASRIQGGTVFLSGGTTTLPASGTPGEIFLYGGNTGGGGRIELRVGDANSGPVNGTINVMAAASGAPARMLFNSASNAGFVGLQAPTIVGNSVTYSLPTDDAPGLGYALTSDGAGNLSWILGAVTSQIIDLDLDTFVRVEATPDSDTIVLQSGDNTGNFAVTPMLVLSASNGVSLNTPAAVTLFGPQSGDMLIGTGTSTTDSGVISVSTGNADNSTGSMIFRTGVSSFGIGGDINFVSGNGGVAGGGVNLTAGTSFGPSAGGVVNITAGDADNGGGNINLTAGSTQTGFSGNVLINAGQGNAAGSIGGNIVLQAGPGELQGGEVNLTGGSSITGNSGGINLTTLPGAIGGPIQLNVGNSVGQGAAVALQAGFSSTSTGGVITIIAGNTSGPSQAAGDVSIIAGNATNPTGIAGGNVTVSAGDAINGGNVLINGGNGRTGGSGGNVTVQSGAVTSGSGPGSAISLISGNAISARGGDISLRSGDSNTGIGEESRIVIVDMATDAASVTGILAFQEVGGPSVVGFRAPSVLATDTIWTLPAIDGLPSQALSTDGTGNLSWQTVAAPPSVSVILNPLTTGAPVPSVYYPVATTLTLPSAGKWMIYTQFRGISDSASGEALMNGILFDVTNSATVPDSEFLIGRADFIDNVPKYFSVTAMVEYTVVAPTVIECQYRTLYGGPITLIGVESNSSGYSKLSAIRVS
jgi:hypothetical protein